MRKLHPSLFNSDALKEYQEGQEILKSSFPLISVLGGSRLKKSSPEYSFTVDLCSRLALQGFNIVSGGGPGIMEAANKGASLVEGRSYGMNLTGIEENNPYISPGLSKKFSNFTIRKLLLIEHSLVFLFFPGGFGTYDELFEILALIQTGRIPAMPLFLIGNTFWSSFLNHFYTDVIEKDYADAKFLDTVLVTEDMDDIITKIEAEKVKHRSL